MDFQNKQKNSFMHSLKFLMILNVQVYEPFERTKNLISSKNGWAYEIAKKILKT